MKAFSSSVLFVGILTAIAISLDLAYGAASRLDRTSKVNWVFAFHGTAPDYALLGSSRGAVTVEAGLLNRSLGMRGINISQNGAGYTELALMWSYFLQRNRPARLLLEVDLFGFDTAALSHPFHEYYYLPYLSDSLIAASIRETFGARAYVWAYIPLFKYAEFNDRIGLKSILRVAHRAKPNFDSIGSELRNGNMPDSLIANLRDTTYGIDSLRLASLVRILDAAREHGIPVTMFMAPEHVEARRHVRNERELMELYRSLNATHGARFVEFDDQAISEDKGNFYNPEHLNRPGALLFTRLLADSLRSSWAVPRARPR